MIRNSLLLILLLVAPLWGTLGSSNLPENFHLAKLDNGLEVLIVEDRTVPLVTIEIAVHNGAFT